MSPPQGPVLGPPVALSTGQPSPRRPVVHLSKNKCLPHHPVLCICSIQSRSCGGPCYPLEGRICFNSRQGGLPGLWVYQGCWSCRAQLSQQSGVPTLPPEAFPLPQQSGSGPNISAFFTPSAAKKVDSTTTCEHKRPSRTCGAEEGAFPHWEGPGSGEGQGPEASPSAPGLPASPQPQLDPKLEGPGHHTGRQDGEVRGWDGGVGAASLDVGSPYVLASASLPQHPAWWASLRPLWTPQTPQRWGSQGPPV